MWSELDAAYAKQCSVLASFLTVELSGVKSAGSVAYQLIEDLFSTGILVDSRLVRSALESLFSFCPSHESVWMRLQSLRQGVMTTRARQRRRLTNGLQVEGLEQRVLLSSVTLTPSKDNTLFESTAGTLSDGAGIYMYAGNIRTDGLRRALMAFNIADSIPAGSTINSVSLTLHESKAPPTGGSTSFDLQALLADWGEGTSDSDGPSNSNPGGQGASATTGDATWTNRFFRSSPTSTWATAGGDFSETASATTSVGALGFYTWTSAVMKSDVQNWLDHPEANFGWILKASNEATTESARRFDSRQNSTAANRPKLTIDYTAPVTESAITVSVAPASVQEDSGTGMVVTFARTGDATNSLTVNFGVSGTATLGTDFVQAGADSFSSTAGSVTFGAGQATATVTVTPESDAIQEPDESIQLTVTSGTGYTIGVANTAAATILNDDVVIDLSSKSIAEDQPSGSIVGTLSSAAGGNLTYSLVSGSGADDNAAFTIVGNQLQTNQVFDFEAKATYSIRVQVSDGQNVNNQETFTITVTNVNESPTDLSLSSSSIAENAPSGASVGTFSSIDPDSGATFTYSLVAGTGDSDNSSFVIVGSQLKTAASFDFETQATRTVRVRVTDQGGLTLEKSFVLSIVDVNESPVLTIGGGTPTFSGKTKTSVAILPNVTVSDPDTADGFGLGGGKLVISLNAVTASKSKKGVTTTTTPDIINLNNLATIGTLTTKTVTPKRLDINIQLLTSVTASQIQAFLRAITFETSGTGLKQTTRTIQLQVKDAAGSTISGTQTVTISKK